MPSSDDSLALLEAAAAGAHGREIRLGLRPAYFDLLAKLGNPHLSLPPVFHVAGTNGKGSVCAFLRAMLEAAGYKVHVYTSPHLVRVHERIRLAGELIREDELAALLDFCIRATKPGDVTPFEVLTASAFAAFHRHPADAVILEVGLGGRLDATNVVPAPCATVITRLSLDHRDYLGDTLADIAREKAGIMKRGVPCFTINQPDDSACAALRAAADVVQAPLFAGGTDWNIARDANGFGYRDAHRAFTFPRPALLGDHQYENAGLAVAALAAWPEPLSMEAIAEGLRRATWPARLQNVSRELRAALPLPHGWELWLDGGHNDSAGDALARQAQAWREADNGKGPRALHLVCGMLASKRPYEFLRPLAPYAASLCAVPVPGKTRSFLPEDLANEARRAGIVQTRTSARIEEAMTALNSAHAAQDIRVMICGSLYLAGDVLRRYGKNE